MKKYFEKIHLSMDSLPTYLAKNKKLVDFSRAILINGLNLLINQKASVVLKYSYN